MLRCYSYPNEGSINFDKIQKVSIIGDMLPFYVRKISNADISVEQSLDGDLVWVENKEYKKIENDLKKGQIVLINDLDIFLGKHRRDIHLVLISLKGDAGGRFEALAILKEDVWFKYGYYGLSIALKTFFSKIGAFGTIVYPKECEINKEKLNECLECFKKGRCWAYPSFCSGFVFF